ncbi:hypothetical protein L7F22_011021 [Adiantum nelumboides]|nr:hypothetical protein [Adiantum nelumboides]
MLTLRVKPASVPEAEKNSVLISSHIDTVITSPGAGDCNSNIGVMLELLRAVSHWAHGFRHSAIFLLNTGEEEGLDGAHSFITQVVHVIEVGPSNGVQMPTSSYISLSSLTPGKLMQELDFIKEEGFACERGLPIDMVTHVINYGCTSFTGQDGEENHLSEHPTLGLEEEKEVKGERVATFRLNVQAARRWVMAINTTSLESFQLDAIKGASGEKEVLASRQAPESVDGWHVIQFVTDQDGPSSFELSLSWSNLTSLSWQSGFTNVYIYGFHLWQINVTLSSCLSNHISSSGENCIKQFLIQGPENVLSL